MAKNIGTLAIHDFANMLNMDNFGKFAHEVKDTKGVLYLDSNNKLCNANRHSKSLTIRDNSYDQQRRNQMLRESLVTALKDAGVRDPKKINDIRSRLGLPPEGGEVSEGKDAEDVTVQVGRQKAPHANKKGSEVLERFKPLSRRQVKVLIKEVMDEFSDKAVLNMKTDDLKAMAKGEAQTVGRVKAFLKICDWNLNNTEEKEQSNSILKGNLGRVLTKYVGMCKKNAAEISALGQSKGRNAMIKTALVRNKADFIGSLTFDEGQALSLFCAFGRKALTPHGGGLATNSNRLDWEYIGDLFSVDSNDLNSYYKEYGKLTFDVDDLLSASYHIAVELNEICSEVDKHLESLPKGQVVKSPEKPVEAKKPEDADDLWLSDVNDFCERFLLSLCDQGQLLNPDDSKEFREFLKNRHVPEENVDSYVDAWKILTRSESVNGRFQSGAATNPRLLERLRVASEAIKAGDRMPADDVKARLKQTVFDEIESIANLMKDGRLVEKLDKDVKLADLFEPLSVHYDMDPVVSTYNALMLTGRANEYRQMAVRVPVPGGKTGESTVSQWNFPCLNKDGKQIVVTGQRVSDMKVYESKNRNPDAWYSKWGASDFEKAAFCALQDGGFVDSNLSFGVPFRVTDAFQLFGLGQPKIFGRDEGMLQLADVLQFAYEAQCALSEGRPCVLRQDGHCYPVVAVDLSQPFNPKIRVAEGLVGSFGKVEFAFDPVSGGKSLKRGFEIFVSPKALNSEESTIEASQTEAQDNVIDTTLKQGDVIDTTLNGLDESNHRDVNGDEVNDGGESETVHQEDERITERNENPKVEESKVEKSKVEEPKVEEPKVEEPKVEGSLNVSERKIFESTINEPQKQVQETSLEKKDLQQVEPQQVVNQQVEPQPVANQPVAPQQMVNQQIAPQPMANQQIAPQPVEQSRFSESWVREVEPGSSQYNQRSRIRAFHTQLTDAQRSVVEQNFIKRKADNLALVQSGRAYPASDYKLWQDSYCEFVLRGLCNQGGLLNPQNEEGFKNFLREHTSGLTQDTNALVAAWKVLTKYERRGDQIMFSVFRDAVLWEGLRTIAEKIPSPRENVVEEVTPDSILEKMKKAVLDEISRIADAMKESQVVKAENFPAEKDFSEYFKPQAPCGNTCPIISTVNAMLSSSKSEAIKQMMSENGDFVFPYQDNGQSVKVTENEIRGMKIPQINPYSKYPMGPFSVFEKAVFLALQKTGLLGSDADGKNVQLGGVFEVSGVFRLFGMAEPLHFGKPSGHMMNSEVLQHAHRALKALGAGKPCVFRQDSHFLAITGVDLSNPADPKITVVESIGQIPSQMELTISNGKLQKPFQIYIGS